MKSTSDEKMQSPFTLVAVTYLAFIILYGYDDTGLAINKCLADIDTKPSPKDTNAVPPVRFEQATSQSRVSTTRSSQGIPVPLFS